MSDADLAKILDFAVELDRLKAVLRRTKPVGLDRYENSAEHSWHLCVVALALARQSVEVVDLQRVIEILLVHDVPEIDCGDHFVYSRDPVAIARIEESAAERIFGLLPPEEGERLLARWREYEERTTPEARFAYAVDRLLPVLHNLRGGARSWRENGVSREQVKAVTGAIGDCFPELWEQLESMIDAVFANGTVDSSSG